MLMTIDNISDENLYEAVQKCTNLKQVLKYLGIPSKSNTTMREVKKKIQELGCDMDHWENRGNKESRIYDSLEDKLVEQSWYTNTTQLKKDLIKNGILKNECVECFVTTVWNGKVLELQLDHIDGNNRNNSISNLRILCPNCHSQTSTFCRRKS